MDSGEESKGRLCHDGGGIEWNERSTAAFRSLGAELDEPPPASGRGGGK